VITGGSEGIGRHLANEFAAAGHILLLISRTQDALDRAADELRRDHGAEVYTAAIDLVQPDPVGAVQAALDRHGLYADILVNNAAIGIGGVFLGQDPPTLVSLCRLNMEALTSLTRFYLNEMIPRARGGVLNIASIGGMLPGPNQAAYYASKAYVISLTEALASENAGKGVRISVAAPGPVATRFHERMGSDSALYLRLQHVMSAARAARIIHSGFMGYRTVIVPGIISTFLSIAIGFIPHAVLTPFMGLILKRQTPAFGQLLPRSRPPEKELL
jgi:hypothetical protein